jgi:hypothetical protein
VNEEVALPTGSASYVEFVLFRYSVRYSIVRLAPAPFFDQALLTSTPCWLIKAADRSEWLVGWLVGISYTVSAANPQLCPGARRGRQPTRCRCDTAPPHFTLERAICPQRPGVVWFLSTTMYFSSLEVTSFTYVCVLRTLFPYVCRTRSPVCAALFKARRGTVASCFASVIPSVSP